MNQDVLIKQIVEEVLKTMGGEAPVAKKECCQGSVSKENYPLGEKIPDQIKSQSGMNLADITLEKVIAGQIKSEDMRISPETLEMQAQVAESVNRGAFASNLRRAAELISVPDKRILEIYNALRPYRSTKVELLAIADELETKYGCKVNADFVREAADVYEKRGRLKA
ncbi:diol dehydratase small subunit [Romboutsia ilealis]|uniref:Diol dehydratase small subunit n=1 Tax=Romboutsia faecis TaxID=2764597 RepID=A0ABR7JSM3_9FIRM|nr:diol dehydratase small subunit [Romboutsia faecis]MBC5997918.1 diol dehydratase small subunit [Romboutsia faecis]MRN25613.1 diol dehydratase small subunit [Romboutsia ilealis]